MKIMILNSSGNVGKSTITSLFSTKMESTKIIEVETVNKGNSEVAGLDVFKFDSKDNFADCYEQIVMNENVVLDIGASSLGNFMDSLAEYAGIETLFDVFIIPSISDDKIQTDTFKTIQFLRALEVEDSKIKVIFNRVKNTVEAEFSDLLNAPFDFDTSLFIKESSVFKELGFLRLTADEVFHEDAMYYTQKMLIEKDTKQKAMFLKMDLTNKMLHKTKENLDYIFEKTTGEKVFKAEKKKSSKKEEPQEELALEEEDF